MLVWHLVFYTNHLHWVDFLDLLTCYGETKKKLEHSICVSLSSTECISVTRVMNIVKFNVSDYLRCLAARTH